jgi:hypothetical protein
VRRRSRRARSTWGIFRSSFAFISCLVRWLRRGRKL